VASLLADAGVIVIASFISPFRAGRERARMAAGKDRFYEIFLDTPLSVCETRDPKGLYVKARSGKLPDFTGIGSPYEPPLTSELTLSTDSLSLAECVERVIQLLQKSHI
jgi:adenylylsulfate kinase-like enzyme